MKKKNDLLHDLSLRVCHKCSNEYLLNNSKCTYLRFSDYCPMIKFLEEELFKNDK